MQQPAGEGAKRSGPTSVRVLRLLLRPDLYAGVDRTLGTGLHVT